MERGHVNGSPRPSPQISTGVTLGPLICLWMWRDAVAEAQTVVLCQNQEHQLFLFSLL